ANLSVDQITFTGSGYTIAGATPIVLTLTGNPTTQPCVNDTVGGNTFAISLPIALTGTNQMSVSTGTLVLTSALLNGTPAGGLDKSGSGTLRLTNSGNSYTGSTAVNAGILDLGASNVLPDASAVFVTVGAALNLGANNDTVAGVTLTGGLISG